MYVIWQNRGGRRGIIDWAKLIAKYKKGGGIKDELNAKNSIDQCTIPE